MRETLSFYVALVPKTDPPCAPNSHQRKGLHYASPPSSSGIPPKNIGEGYYNYVKSVKEKALFTRISHSVAATELSEMNEMSSIHN